MFHKFQKVFGTGFWAGFPARRFIGLSSPVFQTGDWKVA
jgi:hypothetical protein